MNTLSIAIHEQSQMIGTLHISLLLIRGAVKTKFYEAHFLSIFASKNYAQIPCMLASSKLLLCWSKHQQRLWMGSDPLRTLRWHDAPGSNTDDPAAEFFLASSFSEEIPVSQRRRSFHLKTRSVFLMLHTFSGLQANNKPQQSSTRSLIVAKETRDTTWPELKPDSIHPSVLLHSIRNVASGLKRKRRRNKEEW